MVARVIPILSRPSRAPALASIRLSGDTERAAPLLAALGQAVGQALGPDWPAQRWLREIRLSDHEAVVTLAPDLGHDGLAPAEVAFQTLRRLLPDTDIYVGATA